MPDDGGAGERERVADAIINAARRTWLDGKGPDFDIVCHSEAGRIADAAMAALLPPGAVVVEAGRVESEREAIRGLLLAWDAWLVHAPPDTLFYGPVVLAVDRLREVAEEDDFRDLPGGGEEANRG